MNTEIVIKEGLVTKTFEAKLASKELRERVEIFKKYLKNKNKSKIIKGKVEKF